MSKTTHIRLYQADKDRIEELTDGDKSWPAKITEIVKEVEANR